MTIIEHVRRTPLRVWRHNREMSRMVDGMLPKDKTWEVALAALVAAIVFSVMFVRWWLV